MPNCIYCRKKIEFVRHHEKWIAVEPYEFNPVERYSRQQRIPIPYDPLRHIRHVCINKPQPDYSNVYRGD